MISRRLSAISGGLVKQNLFSSRWFASLKHATLVFLFGVFVSANAATLPPGFTETLIAGGLSSPTAMDFAPDGRLFVCLQGGNLRVIKNGSLLPTPFLTLTVDASGERGLLGIAFDPNFASNQFVYVYYTVPGSPPHNRVSRFTADGDVALAGSEVPILDLENLSAGNHNGGAIHFGPDNNLYVAVGENAVAANSQTLDNRLGKILRLNSDGSIPTDNPFYKTATGDNRSIWALGLRNPFTFAFQPGTGRMFINDVGAITWEEINDGVAGSNYGWPTTEGPTSDPNFRSPLFAYGHGSSGTTGCAITGGTFYNPRGSQFPASYIGSYFFADLCSGWIRVFNLADNTAVDFATGISVPVDLKVAPDGTLYYLSIGSAAVFRIQSSPTAPVITRNPPDLTVMPGERATFYVGADGTGPLSYQWQRDSIDINGATSPVYILAAATPSDDGATFRCVVSNGLGSANSNEGTLTVNGPPIITSQPANQTVNQGESATFTVGATGKGPIRYEWLRNSANLSSANSSSFTVQVATVCESGSKFRVVVSNQFGSVLSDEAVLTVQCCCAGLSAMRNGACAAGTAPPEIRAPGR